MAFDFKKEYKEFYMPKNKPEIVIVPKMNYISVRGIGNPNDEGGAYKASISLLYGIAFTIKMSKKGSRQIKDYFDYVYRCCTLGHSMMSRKALKKWTILLKNRDMRMIFQTPDPS